MNSGTGPGAITPDGSPVEFYTLLPPGEEAEIIGGAVPAGGSILELGSGVGRVTHPLVAAGFQVVAVDESAEMLAHVRGVRAVHGRAQELALDRRFDAVVLGSYLINIPDEGLRHDLLAACARHVAAGEAVLIQWQPPEAHARWAVGRGREDDGIGIMMTELEEVAPGTYAATMRYTAGERVWTQSFLSQRLTVEELAAELEREGLALDGFLTEDRTWARAVPA
ncbi:class I SAM-dependent methyltransferase [Nonomuraea sp. NPDC049152]|uniref:class I SAM-dependent methyltransferase n=1 Tax=Nonomuraea sp. NPDC049152 TaxID=3154350 RepID=UPI0033EA4647